jgi:carboxypeptidase Taq
MQEKISQLKAILNEIYNLGAAKGLLDWDQHVNMPPGGAEDRGQQLAVISKHEYAVSTSVELGALLEELVVYARQLDPDSDDACLIRVAHENYVRNRRIDPKWVMEEARVSAIATAAWRTARAASDFSVFQAPLEEMLVLAREYASFFAPYDHVYDPFLDRYEPGISTREVRKIFLDLRPQQVELIRAIATRPQVEEAFLHQDYPVAAQREFSVDILTRLGYDWKKGRLDLSAHPFTSSFGQGDVRLTTRFDPKWIAPGMMSCAHEVGHGLYDLGFSPSFQRTELASGASAGFHESQSRMYENLVGLSLPFWKYFFPRLQALFPAQLSNVGLMDFYRAINLVEVSPIRVEADEATYNLHIMLRMELEIEVLEGSLSVKDLPAAWNERMQNYLGITPKNDALGVLQDMHWAIGLVGYFPSYALGNLISVQLWERMEKDLPDLAEQMERGEFAALLDWLRRNVHVHGRKYEPQTLIKRITGSTIDPAPYIRYLKRKYAEIYGL